MQGLRFSFVMGLAVLLSACETPSTHPIATSNDIVFKRNPGFASEPTRTLPFVTPCLTKIVIDGVDVVTLKIGAVALIELKPGRHLIEAKHASGTCGINFAASRIVQAKNIFEVTIKVEKE